eukprot:8494001-Pyramimonas_sp.AAC.1
MCNVRFAASELQQAACVTAGDDKAGIGEERNEMGGRRRKEATYTRRLTVEGGGMVEGEMN